MRRNPFLPYALILSGQEMEKLAKSGRNICTSFPVPIVEREKIEEIQEKYTDKLVHFPGISFYILFNENLLDEEKLQEMIWEKKQELEKTAQAVKVRKAEYAEYFQRQEVLKNQSVTKEKWQEIQEILDKLKEEKQNLEKDILETAQNLDRLKKEHEELQDFIVKTGLEIQNQKQRIADFGQLEKDYAIYESNRAALEKCKKEEQRFQENQKLAKERQAKLLEEQKTAQNMLNILEREAEKLNEKYTRYATYEKAGQYILPEEISVEQMEARYEAITSVLSQELKDLEERETKASVRFQREQNELEHFQKKYRLKPVQWVDVIYDRKEEKSRQKICSGMTQTKRQQLLRARVMICRKESTLYVEKKNRCPGTRSRDRTLKHEGTSFFTRRKKRKNMLIFWPKKFEVMKKT